jgi:hypothetical protein
LPYPRRWTAYLSGDGKPSPYRFPVVGVGLTLPTSVDTFGWIRDAEFGTIALSLGERVARVRRSHQPARAG